jgi:hypothetical protein
LRDEIEHPLCAGLLIGESSGAGGGLVDVGGVPVAPAADLVAKDAKPGRPADFDRTFGDNAALLAVGVTDRRLLDHKPRPPETDFERRVVQVAHRSPGSACRDRFEHATVEPDGMSTGTERQPVQVDRGRLRTRSGDYWVADAGCRHVPTIP